MDNYIKEEKIGEGTYGVVYRGFKKSQKNIENAREIALKKIRLTNRKEGVNFTGIREIKALRDLKHPNVVELLDVFVHKWNLFLVFEYLISDLETVIKDRNIILTPAIIKAYLQMILKGLQACHKNWILHRDLKPNNLLIGKDGQLKLADFGFARSFGSPNPCFTHEVVTRWYRAPELLFGATAYGGAVDIWAVGCIFAEMMLRTPYFAGDSDLDQLSKIFSALGTPTEETWPGVTSLAHYVSFDPCTPTPFRVLFSAAKEDAIDLLGRMLRFNPSSRISAEEENFHFVVCRCFQANSTRFNGYG